MEFASKSAIESDSSANAGSSDSKGNSEEEPPAAKPWPSRNDVRELERRGVVGRDERRLRVCDVERGLLLLCIAAGAVRSCISGCGQWIPSRMPKDT